jgi:TonB family protein
MQAPPELRLLLEDYFSLEQPRPSRVAAGSALVHALLLAGVLALPPGLPIVPYAPAQRVTVTPLIAPPTRLTQPEPNRGKVSQELTLEGLLPRPRLQASPPPSPARSFAPPAAAIAPQRAETALAAPEPPPPAAATPALPVDTAGIGQVPPQAAPPPPQIQTEERPKLAFERVGSLPPPSGGPRLPVPPRPSIDDAIRGAARSVGGGVAVGDADDAFGATGGLLSQRPAPAQPSSRLELLSDPKGIDFRPYLIRVLASVRRNWLAVIPESARLGRRGQVQIQFAISKDGSVPKLVIAVPSGAEALDRAAVAGISASNPFPPLPTEFTGDQVRLQLTFSYNAPAR